MITKIKTSESSINVLRRINISIGFVLFSILVLFVYFLIIKNHLIREELLKRSEIIVGVLLFISMLFNYLLIIGLLKRFELTKFHRISRHVLHLGFLTWVVLAIFSNRGISINEISIGLFLFFLLDLLFQSKQKQRLFHPESKVQLRLLFIGGFILSSVLMFFFYLADQMDMSINLLFMIVFCGIFNSLIISVSYLLFSPIFTRNKSND